MVSLFSVIAFTAIGPIQLILFRTEHCPSSSQNPKINHTFFSTGPSLRTPHQQMSRDYPIPVERRRLCLCLWVCFTRSKMSGIFRQDSRKAEWMGCIEHASTHRRFSILTAGDASSHQVSAAVWLGFICIPIVYASCEWDCTNIKWKVASYDDIVVNHNVTCLWSFRTTNVFVYFLLYMATLIPIVYVK